MIKLTHDRRIEFIIKFSEISITRMLHSTKTQITNVYFITVTRRGLNTRVLRRPTVTYR